MNFSMYSDREKNIFMFLPDNILEKDVLLLADMLVPDEDSTGYFSDGKPTGCLDLYNLHARYPLNGIMPDVLSNI